MERFDGKSVACGQYSEDLCGWSVMVLVKRIRRGEQQQHEARLEHGKQQHAECFPVGMLWTKQVHVALRKVVGGRARKRVPARKAQIQGRTFWMADSRLEVRFVGLIHVFR
jgi:hypothetical protein